jgi:hypothetical protein
MRLGAGLNDMCNELLLFVDYVITLARNGELLTFIKKVKLGYDPVCKSA